MKSSLLTQPIIAHLPKLYSTDNVALGDKVVVCKFFTPWTYWSWYVFEGERQADGDYLFFGMVHGFTKECGYFLLSELQALKGPGGLKIERDKSIFNMPYRSAL